MKKILILIILIFVIGCQPAPQPVEESQTGDVGVVASFIPDAPPEEVIEKIGALPVVIDIENKGAFDIQDGIITIIADEPIEVEEEYQLISLRGKGAYAAEGERTRKAIAATVGSIPGAGVSFESSISATFCYPYETEAKLNVCIDTDPYGLKKREKVCEIGEESVSGGQGGPIGITRIVTEAALDKNEKAVVPSFKIYIENLGDGELLRQDAVEKACKGQLEREDFDEIEVEAKLAGKKLVCDKKRVKLKEGETFIRCKLEEGVSKGLGTYISPLYVRMQYGYRFTIRQPIRVYKE